MKGGSIASSKGEPRIFSHLQKQRDSRVLQTKRAIRAIHGAIDEGETQTV